MTEKPLVLVDADVLGRRRTGDETYVTQLLRELPAVAEDLRIVAVTRDPDLVPDGIEPVRLPARSQELRMAVGLPRLLRRLRPDVAHFIHALPLGCPCPAVVTVQDLSWERDPSVFGFWDLVTFKVFVRRAVRKAERVLAISERTKRDLIELYGTPPEKIVVTPLAPDPAFVPAGEHDSFLLFVS
ncbi:MAG TPA: glycosyltransferase, partial [Gaiellaceae bacterium]